MDAAKGIAMLLVILDHLNTCKPLGNAISSFYMALFIMISGYFYHDGDWKKDIAKKPKDLWCHIWNMELLRRLLYV